MCDAFKSTILSFKHSASNPDAPGRCELCGRTTAVPSRCDACGTTYCRSCRLKADEGGFDCPVDDCPNHPVIECLTQKEG